ncbi:uroporphyrinogen-III synthase [Comamonas sp. AG1104]|uniref:uroporphyrinogen-III synthase n=1 Tax=Comamonas sp. AG1104 TaxID=2183900 RepID=UPI000E0C32F4|nr:uroporphyrinogen-III synthase [Comamonas sp. AG1104]RDI07098.1 uroporphyrinogen-III synthase [Comamonas sp. AG1104]
MRLVLVTRPLHDAKPWVDAFHARGLQAEALPLIGIGPCNDPAARQALLRARQLALKPGHYRAVMFVSGNAVQYFFAQDQTLAFDAEALLAPDTRAWTPGPGTERALLEAGLASLQIDGPSPDAAQFESEALWQNVHGQVRAGDRVLIVRGTSPSTAPVVGNAGMQIPSTQGAGRDWLASRLREAGAEVELLAVYERQLPVWTPQQLDLARQAASDGSLWLFSSSEAVANLQQLLPLQQWHSGLALTTHERIASKALSAGFGRVLHSRPSLDDVVASIESAL